MKRLFLLSFLVCAVLARAEGVGHGEAPFASGGDIRLELSAGDYEIIPTNAEEIRVSWRSDRDRDANRVHVKFHIVGNSANVETDGPHSNMHYTIEVPKSANLTVRLSAGDMRIGAIEGNKDVQLHAGDLQIAVGDSKQYGQVDLSVNVGDLNAAAFGKTKDGFFRSFHWRGSGNYRLHAHIGAGDLNLVTESI